MDRIEQGCLARPVRADQRHPLARLHRRRTPHPPRGRRHRPWPARSTAEHAHGASPPSLQQCRQARPDRAAIATTSTTMQYTQHLAARDRSGRVSSVSISVIGDRPEDRPGQRLHPAQQHHHQPIHRGGHVTGPRETRCPWQRQRTHPTRPAAAPASVNASQRWRVTSTPIAADAQRGIPRIPRSVYPNGAEHHMAQGPDHRGTDARKPDSRRPFASAAQALGQTPRIPLSPPVNAIHWKAARPGDLRKGQGQHRHVDAGQSHTEPAEQQRAPSAPASGASKQRRCHARQTDGTRPAPRHRPPARNRPHARR